VKQTLPEIEQNLASRKETDRIMWFSMWTILSVASFGIAWFPLIYYSIKRRNTHFSRQEKLEALILNKLKKTQNPKEPMPNSSETKNMLQPRNAGAWTIATLLIIPSFYIFYSLKRDLQKHEEHEHTFLAEVIALAKVSGVTLDFQRYGTTPNFPRNKYIGLSIATLGLAAAYWLYRIFNDYNYHFKMQWIIEDKLLRFLKELDKKDV
jgi:hypothetical protein